MNSLFLAIFLSAILPSLGGYTIVQEPATFSARFLAPKTLTSHSNATCTLLHHGEVQRNRLLGEKGHGREYVVNMRKQVHEIDHEDHAAEDGLYVYEIFSYYPETVTRFLKENCRYVTDESNISPIPQADVITPLIHSGDPSNRIDLVFMGDGYTSDQSTQFIDDMSRLVKEMFQDITFVSYLPVFNIWALYRASAQSGIGVGGKPKDTAFGLYRDGTELRGIYCSKSSAARSACQATGTCDFPTLIGNDPYYGGLGGEFTISTSSETSGTVVLRHEMGHNFGQVGEEYDGGYYFGANAASSLSTLQWTAWLTEPNNLVAQQSVISIQDYAWYDLAEGPYTVTFSSTGNYSKVYLVFSASGCEVEGAIKVTIDGKDIGWTPYLQGGLDRFFYPYIWESGFTAGKHSLVFTQLIKPATSSIRQVCNINMHEYKAEPLFHFENSYIGAYPTWGPAGLSYRPDNELCLMRNMTSQVFCPICQETIWLQFLTRISLIDNVTVTESSTSVYVSLTLLPVAQFRRTPIAGESYVINWYKNDVQIPSLSNLISWSESKVSAAGEWTTVVQFITPEVRSDPENLLTATQSFFIENN